MSDIALPLAQTVLTFCLACWMIAGVFNNWRFPKLNEAAVAMVMNFELMEITYPDDFAVVRHRRITNPKAVRTVFYLMVLSETIAALLLTGGAIMMAGSLFGLIPPGPAQLIALLGTLSFTVNWTGFLIGGEYFCYWYCHFGSQATHLMLAIWGTVLTGLLVLG
jgi:predicted small integral membrane protein